jgi:hypothetical protein
MRKIALLAVVAFAAACGSSSSPGTGYIRVANLAPTAPGAPATAMDFCVRVSGTTTWSAPVMLGAGAAGGLIYGGTGAVAGLLHMSKYFPYEAGTYDVAIFNKTLLGASCANPQKTISNVTLADGGYKLIALVGIPAGAGTTATAENLVAFTDEATAAAGKAAVRVMNMGILALPGSTPDVLPAFDLGITTASTGYVKVFGNVSYPTFAATGGDANGYATLDPAGLPATGLSLTVCVPAGTNPATNPTGCRSTLVPNGSITPNIVASVYVIGYAGVGSNALFCGDTTPAAVPNYSACTSTLQ